MLTSSFCSKKCKMFCVPTTEDSSYCISKFAKLFYTYIKKLNIPLQPKLMELSFSPNHAEITQGLPLFSSIKMPRIEMVPYKTANNLHR